MGVITSPRLSNEVNNDETYLFRAGAGAGKCVAAIAGEGTQNQT
jgi:hypothetical protein